MRENNKKIKKNGGAAMLISTVFFLFISLAIISGLVAPTVREFKNAGDLSRGRQSLYLSESGAEDAYYRLKNGLTVGSTTNLSLDGNTATTSIADSGFNEKTIISEGAVASRQRRSELRLSTGTGVAFSYGVQTGVGGLTMGNNSRVEGSVYSNGPITGSGIITGSALSANSAALSADQAHGAGSPSYDLTFGNASATQDFAQSFQTSTTGVVNKVDLYLKKTGNPGNLTVRIVSNSGGSPGTTTLASGTMSASLVSTNYGWVSVPFSSNPELTQGTTYWLVLDGSNNSSKYYFIGAESNGYSGGLGKVGQYDGGWNATSPSGLDGFFKLYLGGATGSINGMIVGSAGVGDAFAHTVNNSTVAGTIYCQEGTSNNKACNTSRADPTQTAMPISDQNILDWKSEAEAGGVQVGNYVLDDSTGSLGPRKIDGNFTVNNNADLTMTGTLWVTGNVLIDNNATVELDSSYGTSEGVIVADGTITIQNNATFSGSGVAGSYLMVLSTSSSAQAINLSNNGGAVVLYAANGTVNLNNNAGAKALNGKYINLNNNVVITYDSGLVNSNFVNGPSGGWDINSWREVE